MKNMRGRRILLALLVMLMTGFNLQAQNVSSQEAEKKAQQEKEMQMKKQQLELEQKTADLRRVYAEQARSSSRARSSYRSSGSNDKTPYYIPLYGQENQSQLTLRNSFRGGSDTSSGEFDVDESTRHIRCTINGKVRSGKISIKVLYPGGKVFKDLTITSSAEISFSQSLTIKEEAKKKYIGAWKYEVKAEEAEGSYMLSIMTQ